MTELEKCIWWIAVVYVNCISLLVNLEGMLNKHDTVCLFIASANLVIILGCLKLDTRAEKSNGQA